MPSRSKRRLPFVVSPSNHERPFDRLRANGKEAVFNGMGIGLGSLWLSTVPDERSSRPSGGGTSSDSHGGAILRERSDLREWRTWSALLHSVCSASP